MTFLTNTRSRRAGIAARIALSLIGISAARAEAPAFAVRDAAGKFHVCEVRERVGSGYRVADERVEAAVASVAGDRWELVLSARTELAEVIFPWFKDRQSPRAETGAAVYAATWGGVRIRASTLVEFDWAGATYPNNCFAPILIQANDDQALLVAATNWPPRVVTPHFSLDRLTLLYSEPLRAGERRTYSAFVKTIAGQASAGRPAWLLAAGEYRTWLQERMREERLLPIAYPEWMRNSDGWIQINLTDMPRFRVEELESTWARWRGVFPWMQIWGQMSTYSGPRHLASPPRGASEPAGCCLDNPRMHPRYLPEVPEFARRVAREGRIGFYARPGPENARLDVRAADGGAGDDLRDLLAWLERNRSEYGANVFYIDILGAHFFGDILTVARLLRDRFPADTVIELGVDCYPAAMLYSGALTLGGVCTPESSDFTSGKLVPFPRLARTILNDRVLFLGGANGDSLLWGRRNTYRAERSAFLLGGKIDALLVEDEPNTGRLNEAIDAILTARKRVGWWGREAVYRDVLDVTEVTAGVEVRRFTGKDGEELFVADNWSRRPNPTFRFRGREMRLGDEALMIAVLPAGER